MTESFKVILLYYPPILIVIGIIGNILIFFSFTLKKLSNLSMSKFIKVISIVDSISLLTFIQHYTNFSFDINFGNYSELTCKLFAYSTHVCGPISAWILVYISIERFISIRFKSISSIFKKACFQNTFIILIIAFNLAIYSPFLIFESDIKRVEDIYVQNETSSNFLCDHINANIYNILSIVDLFNSSIVPFIFMIISTSFLIYLVVNSRNKIPKTKKENTIKRFKKDVQFGIVSITLSVSFLVFSLPICVFILTKSSSDNMFILCDYLYFTNFGIQFFLHFLSNKIFRNEILKRIKFSKTLNFVMHTSAAETQIHIIRV